MKRAPGADGCKWRGKHVDITESGVAAGRRGRAGLFTELAWAAEAAGRGGEAGGYWQLALVLAAIGLLGLFSRWRKMHAKPPPAARELRARDDDPNRYRDAADRAIVELLETSRTLNAQVDTKIRVLNRLLKDAEEQAARLEGLLSRAREAPEAEEKGETGRSRTRRFSSRGTGVKEVAEAASEATEALEPEFISELHERIYRLRKSGRNVAEIAKATNLSTTEVEFIVHNLLKG